ncbi:MAG: YecA family protein [Litorivicinus sp.]
MLTIKKLGLKWDDAAASTEEALDFPGLHGYVCANLSSPTPWDDLRVATEAWGETPPEDMVDIAKSLATRLDERLSAGDTPWIPAPLEAPTEDFHPLQEWAVGYLERVFADDGAWFEGHDDSVAQALVPLMVLSGLFEEEPDMAELMADTPNVERMAKDVPDLVVDLYGLIHLGEDKD